METTQHTAQRMTTITVPIDKNVGIWNDDGAAGDAQLVNVACCSSTAEQSHAVVITLIHVQDID